MASDRTEGTLEHSSLSDEFKRPGATAGSATVDEILQDELGEMGKAQWLALLVGGLSFFAGKYCYCSVQKYGIVSLFVVYSRSCWTLVLIKCNWSMPMLCSWVYYVYSQLHICPLRPSAGPKGLGMQQQFPR